MLSLAITVFVIVCMWMIFEKLGIEGWKCLIPFYNAYVLFKKIYSTPAFFVSLVASVVMICSTVSLATTAFAGLAGLLDIFGTFREITVGSVLIPIILIIIAAIVLLVLEVMLNIKLSKVFGKSGAFAVGLIFLTPIFLGILAFDSNCQPTELQPADAPADATDASASAAQPENSDIVDVQPAVEVERDEFIFTDPVAGPGMKICPFCKAEVDAEVSRCPYCRSDLD